MPNVIVVSHIHKGFVLPHERVNGLKQAIINFRPRRRKVDKRQVLNDISFKIKEGEFLGIVGRNGSGKSTLLKLLAGVYMPDDGTLQVNGTLTPFIELGVGFNPELSGRENVYLNGALLGFDRKQMSAMYDEIVDFAELHDFMDAKLKNYSSGMQVRLAFSVATKVQSDILLIDEVLAVGDTAFQRKCYDHFMHLKKTKTTVILVTHDMGAVRQYCDRAIMIENGRVVESGKPEEVAQAYQKLFLSEMLKQEVDEESVSDGESRWGTGRMRTKEAIVEVKKDKIVLSTSFIAKADVDTALLGFTIYNPAGINVMESNTMKLRKKISDIKKGQLVSADWEFPNIFASGRYSVSVAVCDDSTAEYYDWLNAATTFNIVRDDATAGVVEPSVTFQNLKVR